MPATVLLALLLAAGPDPSPPPRSQARTIAGTISEVAAAGRSIVLQAADGPVSVRIDRNTMIFLDANQGTARDLAVGMPARVSLGPNGEAHWVELRPKGIVPTPAGVARQPTATPIPTATATPTPTATATPTPTATATPTPTVDPK